MRVYIYRSCVLNVPPRIQIDLPVCKKILGTGRKRYIDHHLFMSFSLRERISRQNWGNVYQGKNVRCISGQIYKPIFSSNFSFYEF